LSEKKRPPPSAAAAASTTPAATDADESSLNQTGFLLQRLQDLKRWQQEQETRLLREQQKEMDKLKKQVVADQHRHLKDDDGGDDDDDDPTIDQDASSLTSYEELPGHSDAYYSSTFDEEDDEDEPEPPRLLIHNQPAIPSWASRTDTATTSLKTVVKATKAATGNLDEQPVGNKKTFEQLLAEQLGLDTEEIKQTETLAPADATTTRSADRPARAFLRKGSGLARYGGLTPVTSRRAIKRSKSQSNVRTSGGGQSRRLTSSTSCSRLDIADRETIASASKRAPPKRSLSIKSVSSASSLGKKSPSTGQIKVNNAPKTSKEKVASSLGRRSNKVEPAPLGPAQNRSSVPTVKVAAFSTHDEDVSPVHDSVEWSFREKLKKADENHKVKLTSL